MTRRYGGTGLGLAISHRLVRNDGRAHLGGKRAGTRQHLSFHRALRPRSAAGKFPRIAASLRSFAACRVLVVDDNESVRDILEEIFHRLAHAAHRGRRRCRGHSRHSNADPQTRSPFALVVADAQMPGEGGFELAREIQRRFGSRRAQVRDAQLHRKERTGIR